MKKLFSLLLAVPNWFFACAKIAAYNTVMKFGQRTGAVAFAAPFAPDNFPSLSDFERFRIQNANMLQTTRQSLYDTVNYPTAGVTSLSLFVDPIGAGQSQHPGAAAGVKKTKFDTNMVLAGQLPKFQSFVVESLEICFVPGSVSTSTLFDNVAPAKFAAANAAAVAGALNDVNAFYNSGWLSFNVSSGNILTEAPLRKFPPKADLGIDGAMATTSATAGEVTALYASAKGRPYELQPLVTLQETANFDLSLNWPNVIATPSGFNASVRAVMDGYLIRATQ